MNRFWDMVTRPVLEMVDAKAVVEIGAARAVHTRLLMPWCMEHGATLRVIDPMPAFRVERFHKPEAGIRVDQRLSIEALSGAEPVDVALVDGDHNYYSVTRELELLLENARRADRPDPVFLCHDVCWPYGRRDLYYDPSNVPAEHRQPNRMAGIIRGQSELTDEGGFNSNVHNAEHEGGPRNGVLTAVEDVVAQSGGALRLTILPVLYGLGIVIPVTRLERHPQLALWLEYWETPEGLKDLLQIAEAERALADERIQGAVLKLRDLESRGSRRWSSRLRRAGR